MATIELAIDGGAAVDMEEVYGLRYIGSDNRFGAPIREMAVSKYAEEAGEHTDRRTVEEAFDYKIRFVIEAVPGRLTGVNYRIAQLNNAMRKVAAGGGQVVTFRRWTLYNGHKGVRISGIPRPIEEVERWWRDGMECAVVELTIHADRPGECSFWA